MTRDTVVTAPERLQTYLDNPTGKRLPFSCTLAVLKEGSDVGELLEWATMSLKAGAGVKLVIDPTYRLPEPADISLEIVLKGDHPDWLLADVVEREEVGVLMPNLATEHPPYIIEPEDNIESIAKSWRYLFNTPADLVQVNLSQLRAKDTVNSDGLKASGPVNFAQVFKAIARFRTKPTIHTLLRLFGILNDTILRGGYKKGIITSACVDTSPYFEEYLNVPLVSLRGSHKKGAILTHHPGELLDTINLKVNYESMFLQKAQSDGLYANVCMGILLKDRGTCLINRVNLGRIKELSQIPQAFAEATYRAIVAHHQWRKTQPERAKLWANLEDDNQIAMDVMGLQNLLRRFGLNYQSLIDAFDGQGGRIETELLAQLATGYELSCKVADETCDTLGIPRMVRLHTVEPAQAHCYRTTDADGYTTCRGIWPPFSQVVNRYSHSEAEPVQTYNHGTIESITPDQHFKVCGGWMQLMNAYGRPHTISFDTWEGFTPSVFDKWWNSPLQTLYYNMSKDYETKGFARKRFQAPNLCSSCAD